MITEEEVKHIAKLARIGITEDEIEKFQGELSSILDYVKQLREVNTDNVEPTSHITGAENVMREDILDTEIQGDRETESIEGGGDRHETALKREEVAGKLVEMAPDKKDGWVKVKAVL